MTDRCLIDRQPIKLSRRGLLSSAAGISGAGMLANTAQAATYANPITPIANDEDLEATLPSLSNWGPAGKQGMYNGYPIEDVTPSGALRLGIERVGEVGIVGRGVLLDVAEVRGGPLPLGSAIMPADLEAAERLHGVRVGDGDILFVRNGAGPRNTYKHATGLHAACLPWLRDRRVAVLSSDSDSDAHPPIPDFRRWTEPMHMVGIPYLGMTLLDHAELDALAAACAMQARWAFFVTVAPWRFKGATGSAVNPLALF